MPLDLLHFKGMADIVNAKIKNYSKRRVQEIDNAQDNGRRLPAEDKHRQAEKRKLQDTIGERPGFFAVILRIVFTVGLMLIALRFITGEPIFFSSE